MSTLPPVCILTAGKGARMGAYTEKVNKALLPLDNRAIISHILDRFSADTEFVIGVGYLKDQVRQYLSIAHPDRQITFVEVKNYDGPKSGPGLSLLYCRSHLQRPFYFVSCDTLWDNELPMPLDHNWLGVSPVPITETSKYCTLKTEDHRITELKDKELVTESAYQAFVGLCYIHDYDIYWEALERSDIVAGEHQMTTALSKLIDQCDVRPQFVSWTDTGNFEKYKKAVLQFSDYDFSKSDEIFYNVGSKIIKYFANHTIAEQRVAKSEMHPNAFPTITDHIGGFYSYKYQEGQTLYEVNSPDILRSLLQWLESEVWEEVVVPTSEIAEACHVFYKEKTLKRLQMYDQKYPVNTHPEIINAEKVPPIKTLLAKVPWKSLGAGIPCFIHGDLQFDNILYNQATSTFKLLDWRQEFAGNVAYGDLYYDLAKLRGGITLNYNYIKQNLLQYDEHDNQANFDFAQSYQSSTYLDILDDYIKQRSLDVNRVRLLMAIIYLNMSPLHHYPFDKMLHAMGRLILAEEFECV